MASSDTFSKVPTGAKYLYALPAMSAGRQGRQTGGEISQLGVKSIEQSTEACMQSVARLAHSADPSN